MNIFEIVVVVFLFLMLAIITRIMVRYFINKIPKERTPSDVADEIDYLIGETANPEHTEIRSDGVNFAFHRKIRDPKLESIRQECLELKKKYPPEHPIDYCGAKGIIRLKELSKELKGM